ncbi:hypothetical protein V8C86DRAFT_2496193 [Haematococcus lacustris]
MLGKRSVVVEQKNTVLSSRRQGRHLQGRNWQRHVGFRTQAQPAGKEQVMSLLAQGHTMYNPLPGMADAIAALTSEGAWSGSGGVASAAPWQGTWKVFWAPHISSMSSSMMGAVFEPILYKVSGDGSLVSNVRYQAPIVNAGWLSASGSMRPKFDAAVEVNFDKFWVDLGPDKLRPSLSGSAAAKRMLGLDVDVDAVISSIGRAAFFPQFAVFPVHYLDNELAIFEFTPLKSRIAIVKQEGTLGDV